MNLPPVNAPSPVLEFLESLLEEYRDLDDGEVATYIPELGRADPSWFGIALVTVDGQVFEVGDAELGFTIQSISKPFVFGMALEDHGEQHVMRHVGVEPSGNAFNAIVVDPHTNRPFNPMVNAGAIVTTGLLARRQSRRPPRTPRPPLQPLRGRELDIDEAVFKSEKSTGDRNRAIGYLMASFEMLAGDVETSLDLYFRQCAFDGHVPRPRDDGGDPRQPGRQSRDGRAGAGRAVRAERAQRDGDLWPLRLRG